jgi:thymidine phosphorylase
MKAATILGKQFIGSNQDRLQMYIRGYRSGTVSDEQLAAYLARAAK